MKKIIVLIIIILIIGFFWFKGKETTAPAPVDVTTEGTLTTAPAQTQGEPAPVVPTTAVKEFTVLGSNFTFTPNTMEVKQGDTVKITLQSVTGFHDLTLDEFNVATKQ